MFSQNMMLKDGEYTQTIYGLIKDERYDDLINIMNSINNSGTTRAGLSLLGFCYYQTQRYVEAANCYEQLCVIAPLVNSYRLYYAQSLYESGIFDEASKVCDGMDAPEYSEQVLQLQSLIQYSREDYAAAQAIMAMRNVSESTAVNDEGCLFYMANLYDEALQRYNTSLQIIGFNPSTTYNVALCHYRKRENSTALNFIAEIIERGIRNFPELGVGAQVETEGGARSVGNPNSLAISALLQALNLKAAIEYQEGNVAGAREALLDLPPRTEQELDPVTLHNMALTDPKGPGAGLRRLAFLLDLGPPMCPPETFSNILLLCCKYEMYDTAADILAEHTSFTYKYLSPYLYELLDALISAQTSPEDAEQKLSTLAGTLSGKLRTLASKVQDCRGAGNQNNLRKALKEYEDALENYLPVVMARAWIPWRQDDFPAAEREFRSSSEFCSETIVWRLHAAHVLFMRGDKFREAVAFYEPIVRQSYDDILSVSAAVLANLCVSYIMTSQNEEAEELMRKVEKAEEQIDNTNEPCLHLCIVNLVLGTLYCAKSNYEFGLSRIAHALDGGSGARLCVETWLHVKRCVLGLSASLAKLTVVLPSAAIQEVLSFLRACEVYGVFMLIPSNLTTHADAISDEPLTIGIESRKLRLLLTKLMDYD